MPGTDERTVSIARPMLDLAKRLNETNETGLVLIGMLDAVLNFAFQAGTAELDLERLLSFYSRGVCLAYGAMAAQHPQEGSK